MLDISQECDVNRLYICTFPLLQMESKRSPAFLGALTECVGAHVTEFSKIFEEMHRLQPGLDSLREVVTGLKAQEEAQRVSSGREGCGGCNHSQYPHPF